MDITFPLIGGLIASILHVISGPDHLAAVLPFAIESKKKAWKIGLFWGIGHLLGMLLIGLLVLLFKDLIPFEQISEYSEQLVGIVLIGIGTWALYRIFKQNKKHTHLHIHSEDEPVIHEHAHNHTTEFTHEHSHEKPIKQSYVSSLGIGVLHGLAGVAHFIMFLPVLGFESQFDSILYILGFALGTVIAMVSFAFVIGKASDSAKAKHNPAFFTGIRFAGGLIALVVGFYWTFSSL